MKNIVLVFLVLLQVVFASDKYYYESNKKVMLTQIANKSRSIKQIDYYKNENGVILGVTNQLILKLKDDSNLQKYLNDYNLTVKSKLGNNLFLLKTENNNLTIDTANALREKGDVVYSHPDFIKKIMSR